MGPAAARSSASSRNRVTPMPALPETITVVAVPPAAVVSASNAGVSLEPATVECTPVAAP